MVVKVHEFNPHISYKCETIRKNYEFEIIDATTGINFIFDRESRTVVTPFGSLNTGGISSIPQEHLDTVFAQDDIARALTLLNGASVFSGGVERKVRFEFLTDDVLDPLRFGIRTIAVAPDGSEECFDVIPTVIGARGIIMFEFEDPEINASTVVFLHNGKTVEVRYKNEVAFTLPFYPNKETQYELIEAHRRADDRDTVPASSCPSFWKQISGKTDAAAPFGGTLEFKEYLSKQVMLKLIPNKGDAVVLMGSEALVKEKNEVYVKLAHSSLGSILGEMCLEKSQIEELMDLFRNGFSDYICDKDLKLMERLRDISEAAKTFNAVRWNK